MQKQHSLNAWSCEGEPINKRFPRKMARQKKAFNQKIFLIKDFSLKNIRGADENSSCPY